MAGIDHNSAALSLREGLAVFTVQAGEMIERIVKGCAGGRIQGGVLLSTCNRSELYLSTDIPDLNCAKVLCDAVGAQYTTFAHAFYAHQEQAAARHLCEVACGLHSRVWGEDQILAQVKAASVIAREADCSCSQLEQLFRCAITAAKKVKTDVRLTAVARSAPDRAVDLLEKKIGSLQGKRALVIGSGEMGKISVAALLAKGCEVTMTLRTYKHGTTVIPQGCSTSNYADRYASMEGVDIVVSATASPHYTVEYGAYQALAHKPAHFIDLAVPRDIQEPIECINIDDIGARCGASDEQLAQINEIIAKELERFDKWKEYKQRLAQTASVV